MTVAVVLATIACGKKGPPLAPFSRLPSAVTSVTAQRIGDDVYLSFMVPETTADGRKPADIATIEVYAVTSELVPSTKKQQDIATLVATVPVRPIMPEAPVSANGSPEPPAPLPPGVTRAMIATIREPLTPELQIPVELPVDKSAIKKVDEDVEPMEPLGTLVAPPPLQLPRRHYFVIAKTSSGRKSLPSAVVSLPLEAGSSAPGAPEIVDTIGLMTLVWPPPPDARTSNFLLPPSVSPIAAANATPANLTPPLPAPAVPVRPPLPVLTAKSLGFNTVATTYVVYDVSPPPPPTADAPPPATPPLETLEQNPFAIRAPQAIGSSVDPWFVVKGVAFGVERCFEVRAVDQVFGTTVISPPSPKTCITPLDTFPPLAPKSLAAIAAPGVISLLWDANTELDLAGYIVLRGEAPGDTLRALNTEPVTSSTYRDDTVVPGTRYVYAVVAVDNAQPQNVSPQSNRVEETARQ